MKTKSFLMALLLILSMQTLWAQKVVLHIANNQVAEYSCEQLDSIIFVECDSSDDAGDSAGPSVTGDAINVTNKTATLVGFATSVRENLSSDLRVGFIYCLEGIPNKNNGTQEIVSVNDVAEDGRYTKTITNLLSDTTYYFRSYVYQSGLWFYGKVKSFIPTVQGNFTTGDATAITCFSSKVSGSVSVQSIYSSLSCGICYGTSIEPTTSDKTVEASSENFTLQLRGLTGGTTYYYRTYAIVDGLTRYGMVRTFRTLDDNVVETGDIDDETLTVTSRLTLGGGAYSSLTLGVCYGPMELPTVDDNTVTSNEVDEENNYMVKLVNLKKGIMYYYRAYILIDNVPHYGAVKEFDFDYAYVDLGLPSGTLWATCNVGASKSEEYGDYFAWGETKPQSDNYYWDTYKYCISSTIMTKYCTSSSYVTVDNKTVLEPSDDAATVNWGSNWQMPSSEQIRELINSSYTTTTWTTQNGVYGRKITSKSNGNSIFLPAAGYRLSTSLDYAGNYGRYWSRSLDAIGSSDCAYSLSFDSSDISMDNDLRCYGQSVRPVRVLKNKFEFVMSIDLNKTEIRLTPNKSTQLMATVLPWSATNKNVKWECSNKGVATVDQTGKVTAVALGSCTITCSATDGSGVKAECQVEVIMNETHEYVDLGLPSGTLWATCNVGAASPEEYGDYFAWGETEPKTDYSWDTYKYCKSSSDSMTKYCTSSSYGTVDNKTELEPSDDAATVNWGSNWQMPSYEQLEELYNSSYTTTTWTTQNGVYGRKITSKSNGNSIFLPAAGVRIDTSLTNAGSSGYYWSRSLRTSDGSYACLLYFIPHQHYSSDISTYNGGRYAGRSVRPVRVKN